MAEEATQTQSLLDAKVKVPQSVVFRSFPSETVMLNLTTGTYHGLNPTAGRMLEAMSESASVREAVATVATEYDCPAETIEADVCELCQTLLDRGLIERDGMGQSDA